MTVLFVACKKNCNDRSNSDCKNYDPCLGKSPVSADFVFEVNLNGKWYQVEDVYSEDNVRFRAVQSLTDYSWTLGAENLKVASFIRTSFPLGNVFCTLAGKGNPDFRCFPKDDGLDTVTKSFKVWQYADPPDLYMSLADSVLYRKEPYIGTYYGYKESNPNHKFEITLSNYWLKNNGFIRRNGRIKGLPYENLEFDYGDRDYIRGYTPFIFTIEQWAHGSGKYLWGMEGMGIMNKVDSTIVIEFRHQDSTDKVNLPYIKDKFIGKKVK